MWLIKQGVKFIFYPCVPYEHNEYKGTNNHYNCPIVTSYAENIKNNVEELKTENIDFRNPFMSFESEEKISKRLVEEFSSAQTGKTTISFSQAEFTKLPKYMLEAERIKFSTEQRHVHHPCHAIGNHA